MTECPVCQAEINEDFGLVTCPACGTSVLIDMNGQVDVQDVQTAGARSESPLEPPPVFSEILQPEAPPMPIEATSPDMSELAEFANSDVALSREGNLRFNLYISGLDSVDVRRDLKDMIADQKFLWDAEKLMREIKDGELQIPELSAVKCSVLVQRLRSLPVDIRWEQYAIQQS